MSEEMGSAQRNSGGSWHQPETASWFFKGNIPVETKKGEKPIWWALKAAKAVANIWTWKPRCHVHEAPLAPGDPGAPKGVNRIKTQETKTVSVHYNIILQTMGSPFPFVNQKFQSGSCLLKIASATHNSFNLQEAFNMEILV